jgi:hypothetical protein
MLLDQFRQFLDIPGDSSSGKRRGRRNFIYQPSNTLVTSEVLRYVVDLCIYQHFK